MPTQLLSQSEAFTGMTALRGSLILMPFLSYLKNLTPSYENKPKIISLARIRLRYKSNPALRRPALSQIGFLAERCLSGAVQRTIKRRYKRSLFASRKPMKTA
jgi:hypothetical protein